MADEAERSIAASHRFVSAAALNLDGIDALTFDVFGTVVDWRSSIAAEGARVGAEKGIEGVDWVAFADSWRGGYGPSMDRVRRGELPWTNIDALHRMILDELLTDLGIGGLTEAEKDHLNRAWHRLEPWPDAVAGLTRLRERYTIAPLSNGNVALLTNMAKNAGLPWDCILSAELARHYKPDPEVYSTAADLLGLPPVRVMMVAAHAFDLKAAQAVGMRAAYVHRPLEFGPDRAPENVEGEPFDIFADDFEDLADKLGC